MHHGTYIGPERALQGRQALVRDVGDAGLFARFNDPELGELTVLWMHFDLEDWDLHPEEWVEERRGQDWFGWMLLGVMTVVSMVLAGLQ